MNKALQEISDDVKRPNPHLIGVPEILKGRMKSNWRTLFRILSRRTSRSSKAGQHSNSGDTKTPQRYSSRRATPRHIIVRFTKVELKERMLRAASEKGWVT